MAFCVVYDPPFVPQPHVPWAKGCGTLMVQGCVCTDHLAPLPGGPEYHVAEDINGHVVAVVEHGQLGCLFDTLCGTCGGIAPCPVHPGSGSITTFIPAATIPAQPAPPQLIPAQPATVNPAPVPTAALMMCAVCGGEFPCQVHPPLSPRGPDLSEFMDDYDLLEDAS